MVNSPSGRRRTPATTEARSSGSAVVGGYVDAACRKCKGVTSHIVLAKVGVKPTRVECRTCNAVHDFRPPTAVKPRSASAKSAAANLTPEQAWTEAMRRAKGEEVPYSTSGHYAVGARMRHASLGQGMVARLSSATVCEVIFATGTVKLIMGKARGERSPE